MADRIRGKGLAGFLIVWCASAVLASATIVPPERVVSALRHQAACPVTEESKQSTKPAAKARKDTPETKNSTETRHPRPDPIKHLLRGILL